LAPTDRFPYTLGMNQSSMRAEPRIGLGTDRHRLVEGRPLLIGGVTIDSPLGALGHSDADVALHALSDALLGALGQPDIGALFPDSDPKWRGLDSREIVAEVDRRMRTLGFRVGNVDLVVHLERPKLLPYRDEICRSISAMLEIDQDRVGFQAKTGEGVGEVGESQVIEATAVALLFPE